MGGGGCRGLCVFGDGGGRGDGVQGGAGGRGRGHHRPHGAARRSSSWKATHRADRCTPPLPPRSRPPRSAPHLGLRFSLRCCANPLLFLSFKFAAKTARWMCSSWIHWIESPHWPAPKGFAFSPSSAILSSSIRSAFPSPPRPLLTSSCRHPRLCVGIKKKVILYRHDRTGTFLPLKEFTMSDSVLALEWWKPAAAKRGDV